MIKELTISESQISIVQADAIIHLDNGKQGAIEVKLGSSQIDEAAKTLLKFKEKVDLKNGPSFLAIVTATKYAFKRDDGVYVIPITCLDHRRK